MSPDAHEPPVPIPSHAQADLSETVNSMSPVPHGSGPQPDAPHWRFMLGAGLLAGVLTGVGGELTWPGVAAAQTPKIIPYPTAETYNAIIGVQVRATAVSFLQQGAILGAVLGLAGGLLRRSVPGALAAGAAGAVVGAAAAAGASYPLLRHYFPNADPSGHELMLPLLTHGGIWTAVGAAAGLAYGLGLGGRWRWARSALGAALGAVAATVLYEVVGAVALPLDKTSQPVAAHVRARVFAQLAVAIGVAAGAALGASEAPAPKPPRPDVQ